MGGANAAVAGGTLRPRQSCSSYLRALQWVMMDACGHFRGEAALPMPPCHSLDSSASSQDAHRRRGARGLRRRGLPCFYLLFAPAGGGGRSSLFCTCGGRFVFWRGCAATASIPNFTKQHIHDRMVDGVANSCSSLLSLLGVLDIRLDDAPGKCCRTSSAPAVLVHCMLCHHQQKNEQSVRKRSAGKPHTDRHRRK